MEVMHYTDICMNLYKQISSSTSSSFTGLELGPGFASPDPTILDYQGYLTYVDDKLPPDSPTMFGLHANAEIGYLTNWTASIFEMILSLGGGDGGGGGPSTDVIKDQMNFFTKTLPENFQMLTIMVCICNYLCVYIYLHIYIYTYVYVYFYIYPNPNPNPNLYKYIYRN
jgi:hypothetical protein